MTAVSHLATIPPKLCGAAGQPTGATRIRDGESGPIGDGWSLGDISVVRVGVEMENPWGTPWSLHPDKFRLVFNGTGHELFLAAGANTLCVYNG